jgi:hypothetical protein
MPFPSHLTLREPTNRDYNADQIVACFGAMVRREFKYQETLREYGRQILRARAVEDEAETIAMETARLIDRYEPDAGTRAYIWLYGRKWIDDACDSADPRTGPRNMQRWARAMVTQKRVMIRNDMGWVRDPR